jgi:NhaP-type Na+/H+ or K+/H+ antiporter
MTGSRNGTGTAALAVALVGLVFCWSVVGGIVCGVVAVILGWLGRGRAARREANNGEIATAGIALGVIAVAASIAFTVIWAFAWHETGGDHYLDCATRAGSDRSAVQACTDRWLDDLHDRFGVSSPRPTRGST